MTATSSNLLRPVFLVALLAAFATQAFSQAARGNGFGASVLQPIEPGVPEFRERKTDPCRDDYRTYDGSCNNKRMKLWGSAGLPHFSYLPLRLSTKPKGRNLKSARQISNILSKQTTDIFNSRCLSEFFVFFGQFIDHTFAATPVENTKEFPIKIPADDPIFANFSGGVLPFERSRRGRVAGGLADLPINSVTSFLDLSSVYGSDDIRIQKLRSYKNGRMRTTKGNLLPLNTDSLRNAPTNGPMFFAAGDHRANEHPMLTSIHTLFVREHNSLADELRAKFPQWDDERLFQTARKIAIAEFQNIVFEGFFPAMTGRKLWEYRGYKRNVNPTLSDEFVTAAFRVGHTMVGNEVKRAGPNNTPLSPISMKKMFFQPHSVMSRGVEQFLRGAIITPCQEVDVHVRNSLRDFLFTDIKEEKGFDLVALNLQRGRDHGLPTYNELRVRFGRPPVFRFSEITRKRNLQSALANAYGNPNKVEAWIGLMCEDHIKGASMGKTLYRIWRREFRRMRAGDRFFYMVPGLFEKDVRDKIQRVQDLFTDKDIMKGILLRNTKLTSEEIGESVWKADRCLANSS